MKSISEYLRDVADNVEQISKSNNLAIATLTNIQQRRIDLKQTFHVFMARLHQSVNAVLFDPKNVADSYLTARHALSNYIVSLVLECVVSGNIDDDSVYKMKESVKKSFDELNNITRRLSEILQHKKIANANEINNINSFCGWSYNYNYNHFDAQGRVQNLSSQNYYIENMHKNTLTYFDIDTEMNRIERFINARSKILSKIEVVEHP